MHLTVCYYHVTYKFQSEPTPYSLPECQGTPCLKQAPYLRFKWLQNGSNPEPPSSSTNTQTFSQPAQMIELYCVYLPIRCLWLHVIFMLYTRLRVNPHSIFFLNVKELQAQSRQHIWRLSDSNGIRTHNHLVHKRTFNHFTKMVMWFSCVVKTFLYGPFDSKLLSCHVRVSESINTL